MEQIKKAISKIGPMKLCIVIVCGIFLMAISWGEREKDTVTTSTTEEEPASELTSLDEYKQEREEELRQLLQKVEGVGAADVMITLKASNEKVTLKDNSVKGENNEEKTVLVENHNRDSSPYIVQEKEPEIEGIVVVCDGGCDSVIKREITEAIGALFSIESHKIKIMKSKEAR